MKSLLSVASVLSLSTILISCGPDDDRLLRDAAIQKAIVDYEASRPRAELPAYCEQTIPHAEPVVGMIGGVEGLLVLEQVQLDKANTRIIDCSKFDRDP